MVVDAAGEIVAANPLATPLIGDLSAASWRERSMPWRHFTGAPSRIVRTAEEQEPAEAAMIADLRDALGRFPHDEHVSALSEELLELSPRFAELWEQRPVARAGSPQDIRPPRGRADHARLRCARVAGSDLSMIVYTVPAGSPDAESLALLGAIGLQSSSGSRGRRGLDRPATPAPIRGEQAFDGRFRPDRHVEQGHLVVPA